MIYHFTSLATLLWGFFIFTSDRFVYICINKELRAGKYLNSRGGCYIFVVLFTIKNCTMSLEKMILDQVAQMVRTDKGIEKNLLEVLAEHGIFPQKKQIEILSADRGRVELKNQHYLFEKVLRVASIGLNIALVGPSGSGKTTVVESVAKALQLDFFTMSVSQQTGTHEFFGYQDANGKYVRTHFRNAYENGGVFLLDEFDAGNPNVLAALNQATSNGVCPFPDAMVKRSKDFVFVAAGNTYGTGHNAEYVGRNRLDAATLDRFVFIEFPYDEALETILSKNKDWCKVVQEFRRNAERKKVRAVISPRASINGSLLLEAGISPVEVANMTVFKGLSKDEIDLISDGIDLTSIKTEKPKKSTKTEKDIEEPEKSES